METLIIHPYDATTDFLCNSYKDLDNVTVVRDCMISKSKLRRLLQLHQNIVLMGHGCYDGLICSNKPIKNNTTPLFGRLLIDSSLVEFIRNKNCLGIWCHAKTFFQKYNINGFATGMFVSDLDECIDYSLPLSITSVEESNNCLSECIKEALISWQNNIFNIDDIFYENFRKLNMNKIAMFNLNEFRE